MEVLLVVGAFDMGRDELLSRMREFDRAVTLLFPSRSFRLVVAGGGALVLLGCLARATVGIDVLQFPPELLPLMEAYDLNGRVTAYADHFAYNFEDRLVRIAVESRAVEFYAASLEDLVASKLHSDRPVDLADVRRPELLEVLDWDRLSLVVEEMEQSTLVRRRYREFVANYEVYSREYKP